MLYINFIPTETNETLRQALYHNFCKAKIMAESFLDNWAYTRITHVDVTGNCCWHENGKIEIDRSDTEAIYHELFHAILHNSPFMNQMRQKNGGFYIESLCHTFQYFMEKQHYPLGKSWVNRFNSWKQCDFHTILKCISGDEKWDANEGLPTHMFITISNDNLDNFRKIFAIMNS